MSTIVNKWVNDNYNDLRETLLNITKNDYDNVDDLLHECLEFFIKKEIAEELVIKKQAKWFFIRIALNQYRSTSSKFYKTYKKNIRTNTRNLVDEWWESIADTNDYDLEYDELMNLNLDIIEELLLSDDEEERLHGFVIMLYFSNDFNFAEVARCLDYSRSTYRRQFDEATKVVLQKMKNKDTKITYNQLPLKLYTSKLLKGYGRTRRY